MGKTINSARAKKSTSEGKINLTRASDLTPTPIDWLWPNFIAKGKLHILAGTPGTGKTTIALGLAAIRSSGANWPCGTISTIGKALYWSGEDDPQDTLLPRLIALGANLENIHFIKSSETDNGNIRAFDPSTDIRLLESYLENNVVDIIIIDPIVSAVTGEANSNGDVRKSLEPLINLGIKYNVAIIGITHFTKCSQNRTSLDRVTGSLAFSAAARIVLAVEKISGELNKYVFAVVKSNICDDTNGFYYNLDEVTLTKHHDISTSRVIWGNAVSGDAKEFLSQNSTTESKTSALGDAIEFLITELYHKCATSKYIEELAIKSDISIASLRRARGNLNVFTKKVGFPPNSMTYISLPFPNDDQTTQTCS